MSKGFALALILVVFFSSVASDRVMSIVGATASNYDPSNLNFSKIDTFLPNLGDGFTVYNDSFLTNSIGNYTLSGNGSLSISREAAHLSSSVMVMASSSSPYMVPNMCVKASIANFTFSTGAFGLMVYKDETDYVAAVYDKSTSQWSLKQASAGNLTVLSTANCPPIQFPCTFALLLQGKNAIAVYSTDNEKTWLVGCKTTSERGLAWDMRISVTNAQWRGGMLSTAPQMDLSNFCTYYSVGFSIRDPKPILYSTGQPYVNGNCIYFTATLGGNDVPQSRTGILEWNLESNDLKILSFIYYSRLSASGREGIFGDHAGQIFYDSASNEWVNYVCSWGSIDLDSYAVDIWSGTLSFNPISARGVQIASGFSKVDLSEVTSCSAYDPCVFKVGSEWFMYFIDSNGVNGWSAHYPHFIKSNDRLSWSNVFVNYDDASQGAGMFLVDSTPYLCASNGAYFNASTGAKIGNFNYWMNGTKYTPWTMPVFVNDAFYLLTYTSDIQLGAVWGYGIGVMETSPLERLSWVGSCDESGKPKSVFNEGETICAYGTGFSPNTAYNAYLVNDTAWMVGMTMPPHITNTSLYTDSSGNFTSMPIYSNAQAGNYDMIIKDAATFNGKYNFGDTLCDNIVTLPNINYFSIESNSTVSALSFNGTSQEISFTVSGPNGTTGYVKATVSKNLMPDDQKIKVFIDDKPMTCVITSNDNSWILTFTYQHSTHQVKINDFPNNANIPAILLVATAIIIAVALTGAVCLVIWLTKELPHHPSTPSSTARVKFAMSRVEGISPHKRNFACKL